MNTVTTTPLPARTCPVDGACRLGCPDDFPCKLKEYQRAADHECNIKTVGAKAKVFPYWPAVVPDNQLHRMELMNQLALWENNNPEVAKEVAQTFINLIKKQFGL
jgi:hypothetical protein